MLVCQKVTVLYFKPFHVSASEQGSSRCVLAVLLLCCLCCSSALRSKKLSIWLVTFYTSVTVGERPALASCGGLCASAQSLFFLPTQHNSSAGGFWCFVSVPGLLSEERCLGRCNTEIHHPQIPFPGAGEEGIPPEASTEKGAGEGNH